MTITFVFIKISIFSGGVLVYEQVFKRQLEIFEKHVGPRSEVVGNALRHAQWRRNDMILSYENNMFEIVGDERYHRNRFACWAFRTINMPFPDHKIWIEMFCSSEGTFLLSIYATFVIQFNT